jgi:hypothetical protein
MDDAFLGVDDAAGALKEHVDGWRWRCLVG